MFPRHVRWYRLLLLLLVIVNSDEAIAKTDSNLILDSGLGHNTCPEESSPSIVLDCSAISDITIDCNDADPMGPTVNDLVVTEVANCSAALQAGSSSPDGGPIIVVNNFTSITYTGSGTSQDVIFTLVDNEGNTLNCNKTITIIGDCPVGVDCSLADDIVIDCNDANPLGPTIDDLISAELNNCTSALELGSASPDGGPVSVTNNYTLLTYTGSGSNQDITFTVTDNEGTETECVKNISIIGDCPIGIDCSLANDIVVDCNDANPLGPTINDLIETEIANCTSNLENNLMSPDGGPVTVSDNYTLLPYSGSGTNQDIIFTVTDNEGTETECVKNISIIGDCKYMLCPPSIDLICEEGLPAPITSFKKFEEAGGVYDFIDCDTMFIASSDNLTLEDLNFCSTDEIEIIRTYTLTDDCGQAFTCEQSIIYQQETDGPIIDCPAPVTVSVNASDCMYEAILSPPIATNSCTYLSVISVSSQYVDNRVTLGLGDNIIVWTAINECGVSSQCQQTITVIGSGDDFAILCNGSQQAFLEANGIANVPAEPFVNTIYDACGSSGPYTYEIKRENAGSCVSGPGTDYAPFASFCCDDLGLGSIPVSIRVTDASGYEAICSSVLDLKDLINPTITTCPTDVTVPCTTIIDLDDLSPFGSAAGTDNCPDGLTVVESYEDNRQDCGFGKIIRTFTFKDLSDNAVSCTQTITVYNNDPFEESDIVWPPDNTYTNLCNEEIPTPDVAGVPAYTANSCSQPLVTHSDHVVTEGPGCLTIYRTWVVLDWCQFDNDADESTYRWENVQIISLQNNIQPVFDDCESYVESCGNELTCTGMINLTATATDDCAEEDELIYAYTLTLENGIIINGQGNTINAPYPYGEHSIVWGVTDQCGNYATCAQIVKIKDCKPPNAVCYSGLNINLTEMPGNEPMAEIWASDLDASSTDNCTPTAELEFAFDAAFTQANLIFTCNDAGSSHLVRMYVRDGDGNVGFCKTTIGIQDNHNFCENFQSDEDDVMIAGRIATDANLTMENVDVMLQNNSPTPMHYMTDSEGQYAFTELPMYGDYILKPSFEGEILNGVSTADILHIQRHILNIQKFDSPYKIIAADINNSQTISGVDIIELRKVILGIQNEFTNSEVWRFVNPNLGLTDPDNPFPFSENMNLTDLDHNAHNMDFVGVKTGDVNYSALINGFIPETFSVRSQNTLWLVSKQVERGSIQLTVNTDQELSGFQLAFRITGSFDRFRLNSSMIDIDESNYAIDDDLIKISWSSAEAVQLSKGDELFSLDFGEDVGFELLTDLPMFKSEAYDESVKALDVEVHTESIITNEEWQVFRNTPNPFVENTYIPFNAPKESDLSLSVFDVNGKLLFQESRIVGKGYHTWEVSATDLGNVHGVLYYRLESDDFSSTQPFIRLK